MNEIIINIILAKYPDLEAIYLYGSYARGKETPESDIDVCVEMPCGVDIRMHDFPLNAKLSDQVGKEVHVVFCVNQNDGFKNEWCELLIYKSELANVME